MARQVRIEFPGAFYHVMARGNRLDPIFVAPKGEDQELFLQTLGEACERSGFVIWAWVLMRNHYHLVLETPRANLVAGMGWLQNTYTRRFNTRHKQWGRLFGDRYKSVLVEEKHSGSGDGSSYLTTLLDYVHLNPARARVITPRKSKANSLLDYPWSSVVRGYALPPKKRPTWLKVDAGLGLFGFKDTARDRRRFVERLDSRMNTEEAARCGLAEIGGQTLNSSLRRGWYWGSEAFKETLLHRLEERTKNGEVGSGMPASRNYRGGTQARDHAERHAEDIIARGAAHFGLDSAGAESFAQVRRGDLSAVAVAWAVCRNTTMPQPWIAKRLSLGSGGNVSERVRRFERVEAHDLADQIRKWKKIVF